MSKRVFIGTILATNLLFGHTAIMSCFDNGDNTVTCEGGFSDGSSASGVKFRVEKDGKVIFNSKMGEYSEVTFDRPNGNFQAIFNAGKGHEVYIDGKDIIE